MSRDLSFEEKIGSEVASLRRLAPDGAEDMVEVTFYSGMAFAAVAMHEAGGDQEKMDAIMKGIMIRTLGKVKEILEI